MVRINLLIAMGALIVLLGIVVFAQQGSVSVFANSTFINNSGVNTVTPELLTSYKFHLLIAEYWVNKLNESGINITSITTLISSAENDASQGNYLNAVLTLNLAIEKAAQLLNQTSINATETIINNYEQVSSSFNNTAQEQLMTNKTILRTLLNALTYEENSINNTTGGINKSISDINLLINILTQVKGHAKSIAQANAINTTINILINVRNYLEIALESNNSETALVTLIMGKAGVIAILENNSAIKYQEINASVTPLISSIKAQLGSYLGSLYTELNTTMPAQVYMPCLAQLNESISNLTLNGYELNKVGINSSINAFISCLREIHTIKEIYVNTSNIINEFNELINESNTEGFNNYTQYLTKIYTQCKAQLSYALNAGNISLINNTLTQCEIHGLNSGEKAIQWINSTRNYLAYLNSTIYSIAVSHGITSNIISTCFIKLKENITNEIIYISQLMNNGTITPIEAQEMMYNYLNNITNTTIIAKCLGLPGGYRGIIPMTTQVTSQITAYGALGSSPGGILLTIYITNSKQEPISITGIYVDGFSCTFTNAINVGAQENANITMYLRFTAPLTMPMIKVIANGEQISGLVCSGSLRVSLNNPLNASLILSTGEEVPFSVYPIINGNG